MSTVNVTVVLWNVQYTTHTRQIVEDVLKSPVLGEEDAAYIDSYGSSLSNARPADSNDSILGQMLTCVFVLLCSS